MQICNPYRRINFFFLNHTNRENGQEVTAMQMLPFACNDDTHIHKTDPRTETKMKMNTIHPG